MAYTYDNFVSAANAAGLMDQFSEQDLQIAQRNPEFGLSLLSLLKDNSNATSAEQQLLATEAANQLRKSYGVYNTGTLGTNGAYASSYGTKINDLMDQINSYGSFNYGNQDSYQQLLDSIVNQQSFSYDPTADSSFSNYKKQYMREGDRASANALAQASAASGGRASSYALTAAQQAGNYYAGQLADIIPTLEQNAYSRYLSDFSNRLSSLGALQSDREFDYENWMNEYNMLQNSLGNYQGQDATDYQRYLDAYNQAHQAQQDKLAQEQLAYENALALYQTLGYATPEIAEILGIDTNSGPSLENSSGGTGSYGYNNGNLSTSQIKELQTVLGVTADGLYGSASANAAGGLSAEDAYAKYVTSGSDGIDSDMLSALKQAYPSGVVTNQSIWSSLVYQYGEAALKAAGFYYSDGTPTRNAGSGSSLIGNTTIRTRKDVAN